MEFIDSKQAVLYVLHQFSGIQVIAALCNELGKEEVLEIIESEVK